MIQLERLGAVEAQAMAMMTFRAFRHLMNLEPTVLHPGEGDQQRVQPLAVGAFHENGPLGLALGCAPLDLRGDPELLSLFVLPEHRRRGIGRLLLERFAEEVRDAGWRSLQAVYMTGKPGPEAFERLAQRVGWEDPVTRMVTVKFTVEEAMATRWFRSYRLRDRFEIFPWTELTEEDRRWLRGSQAADGWIASDLQPWDYDQRGFDPVSSVGARLDGKVVGWVINHRVGDTVRFTCSFIREDLSRRGRIVPLYSEAIGRLADDPQQRCSLTVPMHHPQMVAFVQRRCAPFVHFVGETRGIVKELEPVAVAAAGGKG